MSQQDRPPFTVLRVMISRLRLDRIWAFLRPDRNDDVTGDKPETGAAATLAAQVRVVRNALGEVGVGPSDGTEQPADEDAAYLFRPGHVLVRQERVEELFRYISERRDVFLEGPERRGEPIDGLSLVLLPQRSDGRDQVLATLEELDAAYADEPHPIATPDHVLYVTTKAYLCPATEPDVPETRDPSPRFDADPAAGREVRVSVVDTGLWEPATTDPHTPWLHHDVVANAADQEVIDPHAIHEYGGHGTFVAGVVKQAAPAAHVQVEGALTHGGAVYESEIVAQLHQAYRERQDPQIISISAGTHTRRDFALISFDALADALGLEGSETLVIAAAGNDGSSKPFWPAAFDWAIGVGAVDGDGKVAKYSNYGPWVDVYALGTDHVNAFPVGTYHCYEPANVGQVRVFDGLAQWSGTSFATPVVSGLVAAEKSRTGEDVRTAAAAVIAAGTAGTDPAGQPITIVGPLS